MVGHSILAKIGKKAIILNGKGMPTMVIIYNGLNEENLFYSKIYNIWSQENMF